MATPSPALEPVAPAPGMGTEAPTRWQLVVLLGALSTFGPLSMDMYLPGLPSMADDLSASPSAVQLTITTSMIGLAVGQLLVGPVSDAAGRRRPLLVGLLAFAVTSALCALAPSIWALIALRLAQGVAGAAGIVIARAVVRDLHGGVAAARMYAALMLVSGLAPILAPLAGGQLLHVTDWRGIFLALAAIGALLLAATWRELQETLPASARHGGGVRGTGSTLAGLLRSRSLMGPTLALALAFSAMVAYIAGSPFVIQNVYGVSPQAFGALFALNAAGIMAASQASRRVVERVGPRRLLAVGVYAGAAGGAGLLLAVVLEAGLVAVLACLFVMVASIGLVLPNATALAMADHRDAAGSASALLGLVQFGCGAAVAPLPGVAGPHTALPMAITVAACGIAAIAALRLAPARGTSV